MGRHVPVLLDEVLAGLQLRENATVVDCTLGDGGHSLAMLKVIGKGGKLIGFDADPESLARTKEHLKDFAKQVILVRENFVHLKKVLDDNGIIEVDAVLMDLGWSSPQFEARGRGFSFLKDEPLDMRYSANENAELSTAAELLNTLRQTELTTLFKQFGEDKFSKEIAEAIVGEREKLKGESRTIETTKQLVDIILGVYRKKLKTTKEIPWVGGHHPATQVFQALRIAVNREFEILHKALPQAISVLKSGRRLAVITFHSGEDRIVKQFFKTQENKTIKLVNKKPIIAGDHEVKENPRSRSAKLRIVEKI